jgi:hypothetical protein
MLRQRFLGSVLIALVFGGAMEAQTAPAAGVAQAQVKDPVDLKLQEALRERDAIIRNLLERVNELEWRVNGGFTSAAKIDERPAITGSANSRVINSLTSTNTVVSTATYDTTERQATEALDQALIVRGGLLLPSGTLEIDNTTSYFSASSDHLSINGFALLPVLVVGDIASKRVREDFLLPSFTARLGLPHKFQMDFLVPYGYESIRTVDALNVQTSATSFGLGDISAGIYKQLTTEHGRVPDMLANVRFKSTTGKDSFSLTSSEVTLGTGFNAIRGNWTVAKSSDPVVFFGNLSYTATCPQTILFQRTTRRTRTRRR